MPLQEVESFRNCAFCSSLMAITDSVDLRHFLNVFVDSARDFRALCESEILAFAVPDALSRLLRRESSENDFHAEDAAMRFAVSSDSIYFKSISYNRRERVEGCCEMW